MSIRAYTGRSSSIRVTVQSAFLHRGSLKGNRYSRPVSILPLCVNYLESHEREMSLAVTRSARARFFGARVTRRAFPARGGTFFAPRRSVAAREREPPRRGASFSSSDVRRFSVRRFFHDAAIFIPRFYERQLKCAQRPSAGTVFQE